MTKLEGRGVGRVAEAEAGAANEAGKRCKEAYAGRREQIKAAARSEMSAQRASSGAREGAQRRRQSACLFKRV